MLSNKFDFCLTSCNVNKTCHLHKKRYLLICESVFTSNTEFVTQSYSLFLLITHSQNKTYLSLPKMFLKIILLYLIQNSFSHDYCKSKCYNYQVKQGEWLSKYVDRFKVSSELIKFYNPSINFDNLQIGEPFFFEKLFFN